MNALAAIEKALGGIGYPREALRKDYSFADVLSPTAETKNVSLAAFTQTPESFKSAAFGVLFEMGDDARVQSDVRSRRALGAPVFLSIGIDSIGVWRAGGDGDAHLLERVPLSELSSLFSRNADRWSPEAVHRAKALATHPAQVQLDFVDLGLMRAIEREVQAKLSTVLDDVVRILLSGGNSDGLERYAFRATFRLLAAKILVDRDHPEALKWNADDVLSVLTGIEHYYNLDALGTHTVAVSEDRLVDAWQRLRAAVSLRNISSDSLAYVYENTLVTTDTRKLFGTHSTPARVADYIIEQMDLSQFDLDDIRIHEPFSGAGVFLVAALRKLKELLPADWPAYQRHKFLIERIAGTELDGFACEVAMLSLILADYPNANGWKVVERDLFMEEELSDALQGAKIVFCNPPFEDFTETERAKYGAAGKASGYSKPKFVLQEILAARPNAIGIVMPHGFLRHSKYAGLRHQLSATYRRVQLVSLPERIFGKAQFETALIVATGLRSSTDSPGLLLQSVSVDDADRTSFLERGLVSDITEGAREAPTSDLWIGQLDDLWSALADAPTLGPMIDVSRGVQWRPSAETHSSRRTKGFRRGVLRPRDSLSAYLVEGETWLNFVAEDLLFPGPPSKPWNEPKVLANTKRRSRGKWILSAAVDRAGLTASQYFFGIWPKEKDLPVEVISAILNGPVANAFLRENTTDQDITNELISAIPFPNSLDRRAVVALVRKYERTAKEAANSAYPSVKLQAIRAAIDEAVLDGYNLDHDLRNLLNSYFSESEGARSSIAELRSRTRRRGRQIASKDVRRAGTSLSAPLVIKELGIASEQLRAWEKDGRVLVLPGGIYPAFQFASGQPLNGLQLVSAALEDKNPWVLLNFLLTPNLRLGGARPVDCIRAGKLDRTLLAARREGTQLAS